MALLPGCAQMGRAARVNPSIVAINMPSPSDNCPFVSGIAGDARLAIDLGCYRFPDADETANGAASAAIEAALEANRAAISVNEQAKKDDRAQRAADQSERAASLSERKALLAGMATKLTAYQLALTDKNYRNRLEAALLTHADMICITEKGQTFANQAATNLALDFLSGATATASTIVGGAQAKSILSGISGLSTGTRASVNENVYRGQIVSAITKVMDGERQRILDMLVARRGQEKEKYSADEMIRLVNRYHQACSFENGVQLLLDAAIKKAGYENVIANMNARSRASYLAGQLDLAKKTGITFTQEQQDQINAAFLETMLQTSGTEGSVEGSEQLLPANGNEPAADNGGTP